MKAIMISGKPKWTALIMNGKKTDEIRKNKGLYKAIRKLIGEYGYADIYWYCSKDGYNHLHKLYDHSTDKTLGHSTPYYECNNVKGWEEEPDPLNGKVPFKFRCYKVDDWSIIWRKGLEEQLKPACLSIKEFDNYSKEQVAYAIHINDLEIFDEPRELSRFKIYCDKHELCKCDTCKRFNLSFINGGFAGEYCDNKLTKAPQNFCYIEVEGGDAKKEEK